MKTILPKTGKIEQLCLICHFISYQTEFLRDRTRDSSTWFQIVVAVCVQFVPVIIFTNLLVRFKNWVKLQSNKFSEWVISGFVPKLYFCCVGHDTSSDRYNFTLVTKQKVSPVDDLCFFSSQTKKQRPAKLARILGSSTIRVTLRATGTFFLREWTLILSNIDFISFIYLCKWFLKKSRSVHILFKMNLVKWKMHINCIPRNIQTSIFCDAKCWHNCFHYDALQM